MVIAIPRFADVIKKSKEGKLKGFLAGMRSAVHICYGDMENYPVGLDGNNNVLGAILVPKYINEIPVCDIPGYHPATTDQVEEESKVVLSDSGMWGYDGAHAASVVSLS